MPNEEHVKILKQGVEAWNRWRVENPKIEPALSDADLSGANLLALAASGEFVRSIYPKSLSTESTALS